MSDGETLGAKTTRVGVIQPAYVSVIQPDCHPATGAAEIDKNIRHLCGLIRRAARQDVDIVALPEDAMGVAYCGDHSKDKGIPQRLIRQKWQVTLDAFRAAASEQSIYVVVGSHAEESGKFFNVAFLIDRNGEVVGRYCKTHLAPAETLYAPGDDYPVFQTEFGRIGMLICWDMMFPETARLLALSGADLIVHPTLGYDFGGEGIGEMRLRTRAFDNAIYIAAAMPTSPKGISPGRSCVVGPQGHILADAGYQADSIIYADVALAWKGPDQADPEGRRGSADMRQRWLRSRRPETYGPLAAGID